MWAAISADWHVTILRRRCHHVQYIVSSGPRSIHMLGEGICAPPRFVASYCRFVALGMQIFESKKRERSSNPRIKIFAVRGHRAPCLVHILTFCRFVVLSLFCCSVVLQSGTAYLSSKAANLEGSNLDGI